jgi:flavin reductase (DIM6/NTAB) family NADH-FMN oxidoreductase RutF
MAEPAAVTLNPADLRRIFASFTTGVTVVTAISDSGAPVGITANSVTSVSLQPPLLLWCLSNRSSGLSAFKMNAPFAVHVLSEGQADIATHFARPGHQKFEIDAGWQANPVPPRIVDVVARVDCQVQALYPGGDHTIIVGEVLAVALQALKPLVFHGSRFGRFVKAAAGSSHDVWSGDKDAWI